MKNDKLGWTLETEWADPGDVFEFEWRVYHRGFFYPPRFDATWVRSDGLQVKIDIKVDARRGPFAMSVAITAPEGIEGEYRQPVTSMTRQAAGEVALGERSGSRFLSAPDGPVPMGAPAKRTDEARLERVAELYKQALEGGLGVTTLIEREEHVARATAYGLIKRARKAGLLPPAKPGRKGNTK